MTLTEANSALRLYGLKLDRVWLYRDGDKETFQYTVANDRMIYNLGDWDLPIQNIYNHVVEEYT
jgi:hypothetical protein